MIAVTENIQINPDEIVESFIRASGPGGQNVNKVASAVQLRFDVRGSASLPPQVRARLEALAGKKLTKDGVLVITASDHRTQERNRAEARARLFALIRRAAVVPRKRTATRVPFSQKLARRENKVRRGAVKRTRARPGLED